jgi:hypothetical protein
MEKHSGSLQLFTTLMRTLKGRPGIEIIKRRIDSR